MKRVPIAGGEKCPKCGICMQRYKHSPKWRPKNRQPYYFAYWDVCISGAHHHTQLYEEAKRKRNSFKKEVREIVKTPEKVISSIGGGLDCPQCRRPMIRKWRPKGAIPSTKPYCEYWDVCEDCSYTQRYGSAKRLAKPIYFRGRLISPDDWRRRNGR